MVYQLIFASRAARPVGEDELAALVAAGQRNNAACGVTGLLVYDAGAFLQVLEGDQVDVERTFDRIAADRRHTSVVVLSRGRAERRSFPDWAMGWLELSAHVRALPGVSEVLQRLRAEQQSPSPAPGR